MKNPMTPAGIEPATFLFLAQHLDHCATPSGEIFTEIAKDFRILWNFPDCILKDRCKGYQNPLPAELRQLIF
jgi:hypothetical protein